LSTKLKLSGEKIMICSDPPVRHCQRRVPEGSSREKIHQSPKPYPSGGGECQNVPNNRLIYTASCCLQITVLKSITQKNGQMIILSPPTVVNNVHQIDDNPWRLLTSS